MELDGFHHLTAISASAAGNYRFYAGVLGMRLVKRTVNQDDVSAYHLFYADGEARPGTDITFFEWPLPPERRGSGSVVRTGLLVASAAALDWWAERLAAAGAASEMVREDGRQALWFTDPEGQRLMLSVAAGPDDARPWPGSPVPAEFQLRGLGPVTASVRELLPSEAFLCDVLGMRRVRSFQAADGCSTAVFAVGGADGPAGEFHLRAEPGLATAQGGAGGVHHVAFAIPDADYGAWLERLGRLGVRSSGPVDRFYFRSIYLREPGGILCEIATVGPGFAADEAPGELGKRLSLPPFLEARRAEIERGLAPLELTVG